MRDFIWTLIIVWLIYKIVDIFKSSSAKRSFNNSQTENKTNVHSSPKEKDIKNAVKKHLNNEGEYVDFEEVK
ncbi:hypothetical protein [Aurantibacillus circumpalustris]|uniref:hypothetical protein n=1 Tax=Aurantibacillus circumpalustris TaxID=3036359 RepID=UPI00295BDD1B|nr:hypothetical protein [Aurantibacillus circumpalustris]